MNPADRALVETQNLLTALREVAAIRARRAAAWREQHQDRASYRTIAGDLRAQLEAMGWSEEEVSLVGVGRDNIRRVISET